MPELASGLGDILGPEDAEWLALRFSIFSVADLLGYLPEGYLDPIPEKAIPSITADSLARITARVVEISERRLRISGRTKLVLTATVREDGHELDVIWNDQDEGTDSLEPGHRVSLAGRVVKINGNLVLLDPELDVLDLPSTKRLTLTPVPVYPGCDPNEGDELNSCVVATLKSIWPLPVFIKSPTNRPIDRSELAIALRGLHDPHTVEERDRALPAREWVKSILADQPYPHQGELPYPRLIKTPKDAEDYAKEVLASLGYLGVSVTPPGADGGVDARGKDVVAQVKLEGTKTGSPKLQALSGIASHEKRQAVFFSLAGYSSEAVKWANDTGMILIEFDYGGGVVPVSEAAYELFSGLRTQVH